MSDSGAEALSSRIVLDTTTYSHARRGSALALDANARAEVVFVPVTVLGELEAGFRLGSRYRDNRRALDEFLSEPHHRVLEATPDVARLYGELFASLKRAGTSGRSAGRLAIPGPSGTARAPRRRPADAAHRKKR